MKTKKQKINDGIKRVEKLKDDVILKYTEDIDFDNELSLYDIMIKRFCVGELDDSFLTDTTMGMTSDEKNKLFNLVREYQGLCFYKNSPEYWFESLENTQVVDYDLIAYSILDSYDFLLSLAKIGGRKALDQLTKVQKFVPFSNYAMVEYLRNTFIDDRVLSKVLLDMSNGAYDFFNEEQKSNLLNYPEGTLYSYGNNEIRITSPFVLSVELYNRMNHSIIDDVSDHEAIILVMKEFFREEGNAFSENVLVLSDQYRDYIRKNNISLSGEKINVIEDVTGEKIKDAWLNGNSFLGAMIDTPYSPVGK